MCHQNLTHQVRIYLQLHPLLDAEIKHTLYSVIMLHVPLHSQVEDHLAPH